MQLLQSNGLALHTNYSRCDDASSRMRTVGYEDADGDGAMAS